MEHILSPMGWLPYLTPYSGQCGGNQDLQDHWNLLYLIFIMWNCFYFCILLLMILSAALSHHHVVQVYDINKTEEMMFMVLELARGMFLINLLFLRCVPVIKSDHFTLTFISLTHGNLSTQGVCWIIGNIMHQ